MERTKPMEGPWQVSGRFGRNRTEVVCKGGGRAIATVWTHEGGHRTNDNQPTEYVEDAIGMANLRLIVAAPDLLAFVERVAADDSGHLDPTPFQADAAALLARLAV